MVDTLNLAIDQLDKGLTMDCKKTSNYKETNYKTR